MNLKKAGYYLKKGVFYLPRITPGVGLVSLGIRDWKIRKEKPFPYYNFRKKEDLKVLGKYVIQIGWLAFFVLKAGVVYKSVQSLTNRTKEDESIERIEIEKPNKLEKTINYEELLK